MKKLLQFAFAALLLGVQSPALAGDDKEQKKGTDDEFDDEEWEEEDKAPQLKFFELHGYFRARGEWWENMDLGTWNPFYAGTGSNINPIGNKGTSRVTPPVSDRPSQPTDPIPAASPIDDATRQTLLREGKITEAELDADLQKVDDHFSDLQKRSGEDTLRFFNMRLRLNPTFNISDDIRVQSQFDVFDNLVFGSTPDSRGIQPINALSPLPPFSQTVASPSDGRNGVRDSIIARRVWAEVMTPLGQLRFGRMASQWGLGLLANDGNCLDCDYGSTVDRIMFITGYPAWHLYLVPAFDFVSEGFLSTNTNENSLGGQDYDVDNSDDAHQWIIALAVRHKPEEVVERMENEGWLLNGGVYNVFRTQGNDTPSFTQDQAVFNASADGSSDGANTRLDMSSLVDRGLFLWVGDLWLKLLYHKLRVETEFILIKGHMENDTTSTSVSQGMPEKYGDKKQIDDTIYLANVHPLEIRTNKVDITQWAYAIQIDHKFLADRLILGFEHGAMSGDEHGGFGLRPLFDLDRQYNNSTTVNQRLREQAKQQLADAYTAETGKAATDLATMGAACSTDECNAAKQTLNQASAEKDDLEINNFRAHPDYRVDMILWREVIGQLTDAMYFKPWIQYNLTESLGTSLAAIYSRALFAESTPGYDKDLGLEFDWSLFYVSDDNFNFGFQYGILFPFAGMDSLGALYRPDFLTETVENPDGTTEIKSYDVGTVRDRAASLTEGVDENQLIEAKRAHRLRLLMAVTF